MFTRFMSLLLVGSALASFVAGTALAANVEKFEGKVFAVNEKSVTIGTDEDQHAFVLNQDTKITLDGAPVRWADLKFGQSAQVFAMRLGDRWVAQEIAAFGDE